MSQILIARHASADVDWPGPDHDRPLCTGGFVEASAMGHWLGQRAARLRSSTVEILCSSATRTCQTLQRLHEHAALDRVDEKILPAIYEATAGQLLALIQKSTRSAVLLVGHNPGVSTLLRILTGERCALEPGSLLWLTDDQPALKHTGESVMQIHDRFSPQG